ncbi:MAG: DUF367 family protein [Candidatus Thorarchaeota archaeon]
MNNTHFNSKSPNLYCIHLNQCDKKKCTSVKLKKLHLINFISKTQANSLKAIILNPLSKEILHNDDKKVIATYGLIIIDCSWNLFSDLKGYNTRNARCLPPFIAANPVNYGKWNMLSSAEALAAALYITDFYDIANIILSKFNWGFEFKRLNNINKI